MRFIVYSQINLFCILILILILQNSIKGVAHRGKDWTLFTMAIISSLVTICFDLLWGIVAYNMVETSIISHFVINALYFIAVEITSFLWFATFETIQESVFVQKRSYLIASFLPCIFTIIFIVASYWTGWFFIVDESNVYHRGRFYYILEILMYGYVLFSCSKALYKASKREYYVKRSEYMVMSSFIVFPLIFGMIQLFTPTVSMASIGMVLAILRVYIDFQETLVSLDPLTRLNNRNQMNKFLSEKMKSHKGSKRLYLLLMDADYFKHINDLYGHVEGDLALIRIANVLKQECSKKNYFLCRYGGDEFIVICEVYREDEIKNFCDHLQKSLIAANEEAKAPYSLTLSIGYAPYEDTIMHIPDFISLADKSLYKAKRERRAAD